LRFACAILSLVVRVLQELLVLDLSQLTTEDSRSALEAQFAGVITDSLISALDIIRIVVRKQSTSIIQQFSKDFQDLYEKKAHLPSAVRAMSCFLSASGQHLMWLDALTQAKPGGNIPTTVQRDVVTAYMKSTFAAHSLASLCQLPGMGLHSFRRVSMCRS
jgi:hypothetical protein